VTKSFVVVCEASFDFEVTKTLTERAASENPLLHQPAWQVPPTGERFIKWSGIPRLMAQLRVRPIHGHFDGRPGKPDANAGRNALQIARALVKRGTPMDAVILQRDADDQPERRDGLEQARRAVPVDFCVVIGVANPMIEAWLLAGFEAANAGETERLAAERKKLGFDPRSAAAKLTARDEKAPKNPKRVLAELAEGDRERIAACYSTAPLTLLRDRGASTGLAAFLLDVEGALRTVETPG
jgi:hypothetical protein